jgi:hypothetical protein
MLNQSHAAEPKWHVLTFLHPILICQDTYWAQVALALTRFRTSHSDELLIQGTWIEQVHSWYACIILQMSLTCWIKLLGPKFYAPILHQCLVSSSWSKQTKLDQCKHPNKRVKTQDCPLAQILHIACMQIIKSFCPDSPSQSESQPVQLRWFHFVWTRSTRHAAASSSSSPFFFFFVFKWKD